MLRSILIGRVHTPQKDVQVNCGAATTNFWCCCIVPLQQIPHVWSLCHNHPISRSTRSAHLSFSARLPAAYALIQRLQDCLLSACTPHRLLEQVVSCSPSQQKHAHRRPGEPPRNNRGHAHPVPDHAAQEASDRVAQHEPDENKASNARDAGRSSPAVYS